MIEAALALSLASLAVAAVALYRARTLASALETERVKRLSSLESAKAELRLASDRVGAIEQRVGRARRLTPAKRERALELLAHGASEGAIARQLELRKAEVAVLARLRNSVGA